jgi:uncharacterized protein YbjT (DUF2867 family)
MPSVAIIGATGLVGTHCLELLRHQTSISPVHVLVRKPILLQHPKFVAHQLQFDRLSEFPAPAVTDLICTLGTTIRKAGSQEAFRKVDLDYVVAFARRFQAAGAKRMHVVSSVGADATSSNFYLETKGEMELAMQNLNFEKLTILRPSFLLGDRPESRLGESVGIWAAKLLAPLMVGPLKVYRPIEASEVAAQLVQAVLD